ncbi:hypothetical protein CWC29_023200 [Pseudoalteromonas sp. S4498]|uniref:hypothetical protein n=1 Tax=Pseudoalteromonas galatheae TaxID=579562 RepID=UPI001107FC2A|nr:hypothetical protein [Pseudoalteromonas galatheae]NKC21688.1 hypothetical protein [Pseudoalteromonas galatheae]
MLNLESLGEAIALHRAIVQAKFSELEPFDSAIPFSEPLSNLAKRNIDSIILQLAEQGEDFDAKLWSETRNLKTDWDGYEYIKQRIGAASVWSSYSDGDKVRFIEILCSPFSPSQEQLNELLSIKNET